MSFSNMKSKHHRKAPVQLTSDPLSAERCAQLYRDYWRTRDIERIMATNGREFYQHPNLASELWGDWSRDGKHNHAGKCRTLTAEQIAALGYKVAL